MTITLKDIRDAAKDAIEKVTVTIDTTGVPDNQSYLNPTGETVHYNLTITNPSDGAQLKNVRVEMTTSDVNLVALITPKTSTATAYRAATGTDTWNVGDGHTYMYLSTSELSVLAPGDPPVKISSLDLLSNKNNKTGTVHVTAQIHGDVDEEWLLANGHAGQQADVTLKVQT